MLMCVYLETSLMCLCCVFLELQTKTGKVTDTNTEQIPRGEDKKG